MINLESRNSHRLQIKSYFSGGNFCLSEKWAEIIGKCQKGNDAEACCAEQGVPDYCFGYCQPPKKSAKQRQLIFEDSVCGKWMDEMAECREGTEADLGACCKNKGVPYWCSGDCVANDGVCRKWSKQVSECRKSNEAKKCCEKQGVPNECSAYCETA